MESSSASLSKTRYSVPPFGIDVFEKALQGLVLANVGGQPLVCSRLRRFRLLGELEDDAATIVALFSQAQSGSVNVTILDATNSYHICSRRKLGEEEPPFPFDPGVLKLGLHTQFLPTKRKTMIALLARAEGMVRGAR